MLVQRARDELLAGAGFAGDQHRDAGARQTADRAEHLLHRRRAAEQLRNLRRRRRALGAPSARVCAARRTRSTAWSMSNGFGRYSNAPLSYADTALPRSECAVITMTGSAGCVVAHFASRSRPELPGMRMSVISTSGASLRSAIERGLGRVEGPRHHAAGAQGAFQHPADGGIVIDEPDAQRG